MSPADVLALASVAALVGAGVRYSTDLPRPSRRTVRWYWSGMALFVVWLTAEAFAAGGGWPRLAVALWGTAAILVVALLLSVVAAGERTP